PRVVLYASPRSGRAEVMLRRWESWGFRPDAVVLTSEPVASPGRRVMHKLREDGVGGAVRRLLRQRPQPSSGTGSRDEATSLETLCRNAGIPLVRIGRLSDAASLAAVRALQPDLAVYAASEILRRSLLEVPCLGTLNAHMGLLPRYRGMN